MAEVVKSFYSYGQDGDKWLVCLFDIYDDGTGAQFIQHEVRTQTEAIELTNKLTAEREAIHGTH